LKIIYKDLKKGEIKLRPENLDDIWHLYNIIEKGDLVRALTFRTIEDKSEDILRPKKLEKKPMKLGIRVEEIGFHEFSDRLRIHGIIEEGPQDLGSYHTLNIDTKIKDGITIVKKEWKLHHLDRLEEAVKSSKKPSVIFVSLDDENATIAILRQSGIQKVANIESHISGKMYKTGDKSIKDYYDEILGVIKNISQNGRLPIIVIGPGFHKENFVKYGKEKISELFKNAIVCGTSTAGMNGIQEAINIGMVHKVVEENRVVYEARLVEKLLEEISKDGLATYGKKETYDALSAGAVEILLISDGLIKTDEGEELLKLARQNNSKFAIINSAHEAGKKLEGLGGVGALLRFKI
jgi:protein pelota